MRRLAAALAFSLLAVPTAGAWCEWACVPHAPAAADGSTCHRGEPDVAVTAVHDCGDHAAGPTAISPAARLVPQPGLTGPAAVATVAPDLAAAPVRDPLALDTGPPRPPRPLNLRI